MEFREGSHARGEPVRDPVEQKGTHFPGQENRAGDAYQIMGGRSGPSEIPGFFRILAHGSRFSETFGQKFDEFAGIGTPGIALEAGQENAVEGACQDLQHAG